MAVINAWKQAADKKISDYGAITVGNHAAGVAASAVRSWDRSFLWATSSLMPHVGQKLRGDVRP
ncbi:hypothetical protein GN958_ATG06360 [Phytophthora infestans]|nr:hypothetical protein GN958_ATG06360 [Phytophthora infestans]